MSRMLRHIAPFVLLVTYLPMVVMSSLHVHHETVDAHDSCKECVGHLETQHHHQQDCLYCHLLELNYLGQKSSQSTVFLPATSSYSTCNVEMVEIPCYGVAQLRAPPTA